jgi:hypothetical protein
MRKLLYKGIFRSFDMGLQTFMKMSLTMSKPGSNKILPFTVMVELDRMPRQSFITKDVWTTHGGWSSSSEVIAKGALIDSRLNSYGDVEKIPQNAWSWLAIFSPETACPGDTGLIHYGDERPEDPVKLSKAIQKWFDDAADCKGPGTLFYVEINHVTNEAALYECTEGAADLPG